MMKLLKVATGLILLLLLFTFFIKDPLLRGLANYLVVEDDPQKSDVIIVLGGEKSGERTKKAVELYNNGLSSNLLFSDGTEISWRTRAIDEMTALAKKLGISNEHIFEEGQSRSTYENALYSKEFLKEKGWDSAIVVTTDWHTKRSKSIFEHVFKESNITLSFAGAKDERIDNLNEWWKDSEKQQIVLTEWAKTIVYWVKY